MQNIMQSYDFLHQSINELYKTISSHKEFAAVLVENQVHMQNRKPLNNTEYI